MKCPFETIWSCLRLGDHCVKIGSGATPRGGESVYQESGVALIRSQNIYNDYFSWGGLAFIGEEHAKELSGVTVEANDVLLNITGDSVARANRAPAEVIPARVNQHVAIIRPKPDVFDKRYLHYVLVSPQMQSHMLTIAGIGGTRNALTKGMIEGFYIPHPTLKEQQAIAYVLGTIDDKRELNRCINDTSEELVRALFKSWFVDFDPVRSKAEGRTPYGMDTQTAALFPSAFEASVLGEIPQGWAVGEVADLGKVICGKTPPTKDLDNFGFDIPFITIPDMHGKIFICDTERYLSTKGAASQQKKMLPAKSICVSCIATPGLVALTSVQSQTNQQINSVVPDKKFGSYFTFGILDRLGAEIRTRGSGGSVFSNLNTGDFSRIPVLLPTDKIVQKYNSLVEAIFDGILSNERQSQSLASLRDLLLPKLLTGKLRVKDAEKRIAEVA